MPCCEQSRGPFWQRVSIVSPQSKRIRSGPDDIDKDLEVNWERLRASLGESPDIVFHSLSLGATYHPTALLVYVDGICDTAFISEQVITQLIACARDTVLTRSNAAVHLARSLVSATRVENVSTMGRAIQSILSGDAALFFSGSNEALVVSAQKVPARSISEPENEVTIRGPRESFTEVLETTTALIRRRVRHPDLRIERRVIGEKSRTPVDIMYLKGVADLSVVQELRKRLDRIDIDAVIDSGIIEEFISDQAIWLFPTLLSTERPDRVAFALFDGKVAIAVDGSPTVLILPATLWDFFVSPADYYQGMIATTFIRWLRIVAFAFSLALPSFYVALTTFHHEMIPTVLALQIAAGREGTPFPAVVEALFLEFQFEIVREAGLRIPSKIGTAVSIVGVLVIGQALVAAGVVSPLIIIVVGSTAIASFAVPIYTMSAPSRLLRFPLIILSGTLGIFGFIWGIGLILAHLTSLKSFGRPYLAPISPLRTRELSDSPLWRAPIWALTRRPRTATSTNRRRQPSGQQPE